MHVNDCTEEINHKHSSLRAESDEESITIEASDKGIPMPPLPPLRTHANEKIDSLAASKTNTKNRNMQKMNSFLLCMHVR